MDFLFNALGTIGVICFLLAFFLLQREYFTFNSYSYLGLNLIGSLLVIASLLWDWNLPAFILEVCWCFISLYFIIKRLISERNHAHS